MCSQLTVDALKVNTDYWPEPQSETQCSCQCYSSYTVHCLTCALLQNESSRAELDIFDGGDFTVYTVDPFWSLLEQAECAQSVRRSSKTRCSSTETISDAAVWSGRDCCENRPMTHGFGSVWVCVCQQQHGWGAWWWNLNLGDWMSTYNCLRCVLLYTLQYIIVLWCTKCVDFMCTKRI